MKTQEEYYDSILLNRSLVLDPEIMRCTCPNTLCDWHGKCRECVALHRHHNDHIPVCLQPIIKGKIATLANAAELVVVKKEGTPIEHRHYVKRKDNEEAARLNGHSEQAD